MANVTLQFQKRAMMYYSMKIIIDNGAPISIANGAEESIELTEGTHTVKASVPTQGNDAYLADTVLVVKPNMQYEVVYSLTALSTSGILTIKERPVCSYTLDCNGNRIENSSGVTVTKTKKRINSGMIIIFAAVLVMVGSGIIIPAIHSYRFDSLNLPGESEVQNFLSEKGKTQTVAALNQPCKLSGYEVAVTELKTAIPEYQEKDELRLGVQFVIKNISDKVIYVDTTSTKAYVDGVAAEGNYGFDGQTIQQGDLDVGKTTKGYYYVTLPKDAKHVEINMPLGLYGTDSITFSFDVPPLEDQ